VGKWKYWKKQDYYYAKEQRNGKIYNEKRTARELLCTARGKEHKKIICLPFHTFCIFICKKLKNIRNLDTNLSSLNKLGLIIIIKIHKYMKYIKIFSLIYLKRM